MGGGGGGGLQQASSATKKQTNLAEDLYTMFFFPNGCRERQGLVGSLRERPTGRARLRSRATASSGGNSSVCPAAGRGC